MAGRTGEMMTPEQINVAIAEACGWKLSVPHFGHDGKWRRTPFTGEKDVWIGFSDWAGTPKDVIDDWSRVPNYYVSLDAMAEAEKTLYFDSDFRYEKLLHRLTNGRGERAPAPIRAQAFLIFKGKWIEKGNS